MVKTSHLVFIVYLVCHPRLVPITYIPLAISLLSLLNWSVMERHIIFVKLD